MKAKFFCIYFFIVQTIFSIIAADDAPVGENELASGDIKKSIESLDQKYRTIYDKVLNKNWSGFGMNNINSPTSKLIFEGTVDFPYYPRKHMKKNIQIYKYDKPFEISFLIPMEKLDFSSSPEMAILSFISDIRYKDEQYWKDLKDSLGMNSFQIIYYKICFNVNNNKSVAFMNSTDYSTLLYFDSKSSNWTQIEELSYAINLEYTVIYENLDLDILKGTPEAKVKKKINQLINNKLIPVEDEAIEEDIELKDATPLVQEKLSEEEKKNMQGEIKNMKKEINIDDIINTK